MYLIETSFAQHDSEWFDARLDSVGGTDISKIITTKGERSKSRDDFMTEKASQIITRQAKPLYPTYEMKWGNLYEPESRKMFEFIKDIELSECAMIFADERRESHISPDGYNEKRKLGWETKCPQLKEFRKTVKGNKLPTKHVLQVQGSLGLTGWDSWWFMSFFPKLKPFMIEVKRDEGLIKIIRAEINIFTRELNELVNRLRKE